MLIWIFVCATIGWCVPTFILELELNEMLLSPDLGSNLPKFSALEPIRPLTKNRLKLSRIFKFTSVFIFPIAVFRLPYKSLEMLAYSIPTNYAYGVSVSLQPTSAGQYHFQNLCLFYKVGVWYFNMDHQP